MLAHGRLLLNAVPDVAPRKLHFRLVKSLRTRTSLWLEHPSPAYRFDPVPFFRSLIHY